MSKISSSFISAVFVLIKKQNKATNVSVPDCLNHVNHYKGCVWLYHKRKSLAPSSMATKQITPLVQDMSIWILLPLRIFELYSEESPGSLEYDTKEHVTKTFNLAIQFRSFSPGAVPTIVEYTNPHNQKKLVHP